MNKVFRNLLLVQLSVILAGFVGLGWALRLSAQQWGPFLLGALVIVLLSGLVLRGMLLRPISRIGKAAEKFAQGDFRGRLPHIRRDELGDLADSLNYLSDELQKKIAEVTKDRTEVKAILSSMEEGVIVIGRDERIILLNDPVYRMLDLRSRDTIGKSYWEILRNEEINSSLKEALLEKKTVRKEIHLLTPADSQFLMQISPVVLEKGDLTGVVAVFHDVTEFNKLAQMRSDFVANVSHELKTPLTTIKGFVETLKEGALNDPQKAERFLDFIKTHTERLELLVNDLLSLASIESKEVEMRWGGVRIPEVVQTAMAICKESIRQKKLTVEISFPEDLPPVRADAGKLEQVFLNLLDNAVKFTPAGGRITVSAVQEGGYVRTDFRDTGVGIAADHLPRIFERFYRVDKARNREQGGTGLGLSIVKHIVEAHEGKVSVQSEPEKGSQFSVYLPLAA